MRIESLYDHLGTMRVTGELFVLLGINGLMVCVDQCGLRGCTQGNVMSDE